MLRDRVALISTTVVAAVHLAVAGRYDLFRDELYFIICGRNHAFGYADQPPLVPLIAAGAYALGAQTWLVRVPAVVAAAALVRLVVAFTRLLGARDGAAWLAAAAAGGAPMLMGLTATLNTTVFEPLAWAAIAYALTRAVLLDDRRALLWAGLVAGLALEAKYALPLWLLALAAGLAATPQRRLFRCRELWLGSALALVVALPSLGWQAAHGFPFIKLVRNAHRKDVSVAPLPFVLDQIVVFDPLFAPLWASGIAGPFLVAGLRPVRFVSLAFLVTAATLAIAGGKDYYLAPAYPSLFAIGAIVAERLLRGTVSRAVYAAAALALAAVSAPLALPILPPAALVAYQDRLHLRTKAQEKGDRADALPSLFADMLGWHDFVRQVGTAYDSLPATERRRTAIVVGNYGEAAALDLYGAPFSLPPALSGHNQYYFWGTRGQRPANLLRVQFQPERLRAYCRTVTVLATTASRYAREFENGRAIAYCRGLHPPLDRLWPRLRSFI